MLTRDIIKSIIVHNKGWGRIETGWRIWISDIYTLSFYHPHYKHWNEFKALQEKSKISMSPIEDSETKLTERINEIVEHLFKLQ